MESHNRRIANQIRHPTEVGRQVFLRHPPIDPFQKIAQLRRRDRDRTINWRWPQKSTPLKPFAEQTGTLTIMPNDLYQIAAPPTKNEQLTAQGIVP
jgi:hypothetical protein